VPTTRRTTIEAQAILNLQGHHFRGREREEKREIEREIEREREGEREEKRRAKGSPSRRQQPQPEASRCSSSAGSR